MSPRARLELLAGFLESLPDYRADRPHLPTFDMNYWHCDTNDSLECRTTACAAGWAALVPALRADGLRLVMHPETFGRTLVMRVPEHAGRFGYDALEVFFGLSTGDVLGVFDPGAYDDDDDLGDPRLPAGRIRQILARAQDA